MDFVDDYLKRIETLELANPNDAQFLDALKNQGWVVAAAGDQASNPRLKALCTQLLTLLQETGALGSAVRTATRNMILVWKSEATEEKHQTLTFAGILSLVASLSTISAFLLGEKGIIPLIRRFSSDPTSNNPSDQLWAPSPVETGVVFVHVFVIFLLVVLQATPFAKPERDMDPNLRAASDTLDKFWFGWRWIWISWFALYIWLSFGYVELYRHQSIMWAIADLLNIGNGFGFFYCFLVLDEPSVPTADDQDRSKKFYEHVAFLGITGLVLAAISMIGRLRSSLGLSYSGPLLVAAYTGLAMAYLVGRFDSHHIQVPRWMLAPLYLYVMIQLTWVAITFSDRTLAVGSTAHIIFLTSALLLKLLLFFVVTHWLKNGTLFKYIKEAEKFHKSKPLSSLTTASGGAL